MTLDTTLTVPVRDRQKTLNIVTADGVRLAVSDSGPESAERNVVFLHGLCLDRSTWARQSAYIRRRYGVETRVIRFDQRGHGQSGSAPMCTYTVEQLADDLAHVLDTLKVRGTLVLVGHSMGGMAAMRYLQRPPSDQPVKVAGLVLVASAAGRLAERGIGRLLSAPGVGALLNVADRVPEPAARAFKGSLGALLGRWSSRGVERDATLAELAATALASTSMRTAAGFLRSLRDMDLLPALESIEAQTIVISGEEDQLTPPAHADDLVAGIPGAVRLDVPGVGHMLPQDAPHVVNEAIRRAMFGAVSVPDLLETAPVQSPGGVPA